MATIGCRGRLDAAGISDPGRSGKVCGVVTAWGVRVSDQPVSVPVLPVTVSVIWSVQVPFMLWPTSFDSPWESLGLNVPV